MSNGGFVLPIIPPTLYSHVSSVRSNQTFWKFWANIYRLTLPVSGPVRRWFRKRSAFSTFKRLRNVSSIRLLLWDNYPVNDLSMRDELHLGPLQGRDPKLPRAVYAYLSNPLLQEKLSFIPLATCFDYAADPIHYRPGIELAENCP